MESQLCTLAVHGGDLLDCLAVSDCLHGEPGLELDTVGARLLNSIGEDCAYSGRPESGRVAVLEFNDKG